MMKTIRYVVCLLTLICSAVCLQAGINGPSKVETSTETEENQWVEIELESAGNLGVEILYKVDRLADVTHLRVSGPINDADWGNIRNLTKIQEIDLSKAITTSMPASTFSGRSSLQSITLPETLTTIGDYAFQSSALESIYIPASVNNIGQYAFSESKISTVIFDEDNMLSSLGKYAFYKCANLKKVQFSENSKFTSINEYSFYQCSLLSDIKLPESVKSIDSNAFYETSSLTSIELPSNLSYTGSYAFYKSGLEKLILPDALNYSLSEYDITRGYHYSYFEECKNLKEVVLGAKLHTLPNKMFYGCPIEKITCKSTTPPIVGTSAFNITKSNVTLIVPDFAVPDYKLNSYWLSFKIEGGATSDYWDINGTLNMTNNRRFDGTPSVSLTNGCLKISGNAAMPLDTFTMNADIYGSSSSSISFSQLLNDSPLMTANRINYNYKVGSGKWHFLTLPFDINVDDIRAENDPSFAVRYYDGAARAENNKTGYAWKNVPAGTTLKAGTGFIIQSKDDATKTFICEGDGKTTLFNPNSVTTPLELHPAESAAHSGWNLIGNPFPCRYDMYYSMLSCPIIVYDINNKTYTAKSMLDDGYVLYPTQAFFVQASEDLAEIIFSKQGKQFGTDYVRPSGRPGERVADSDRSLFNLTLSCDGLEDSTRIVFNPEASEEYELHRDAAKFLSENEVMPQIYSVSPAGDYLAINERDEADGAVQIGLYAPSTSVMTLSMDRIDGRAFLHDSVTGATVELAENEQYRFTAEEAGYDDHRFTLRLKPLGTTEVNMVSEKRSSVSVADRIIKITDTLGKNVMITSIDGILYHTGIATTDSVEMSLPTGLYIVKAGDASVKCVVK